MKFLKFYRYKKKRTLLKSDFAIRNLTSSIKNYDKQKFIIYKKMKNKKRALNNADNVID